MSKQAKTTLGAGSAGLSSNSSCSSTYTLFLQNEWNSFIDRATIVQGAL